MNADRKAAINSLNSKTLTSIDKTLNLNFLITDVLNSGNMEGFEELKKALDQHLVNQMKGGL